MSLSREHVVGEEVQVHAFGCWYPGRLERAADKTALVTFNVGSKTRSARKPWCLIAPAGTFRLRVRGEPDRHPVEVRS